MSQLWKSLGIGIGSGIVTYNTAVFALARSSALALPAGFPLPIWETFIVFGLGVTLVALVLHLLALILTKSRLSPAFLGFLLSFLACLAVSGLLQTGLKSLAAAVIGAVLASAIARQRSNNSFKPTPLRGAA